MAGALLALPERAWDTARLGRLLLGGTGAFFLGMALLQAWPGRGFWQGRGQPGSLTAMVASMASTPQPHALDAIVSGFGNFTVAHGFAVNLVAVIALALIGAGLFVAAAARDARLAMTTVIAGASSASPTGYSSRTLGFFGGLGTDPNSHDPVHPAVHGRMPRADPAPSLPQGRRRASDRDRHVGCASARYLGFVRGR